MVLLCPIVYSCAQPEEIAEYGDPSLDVPDGGDGGTGGESETTDTVSTMGGTSSITATIGVSSTSDTSDSSSTTGEASSTMSTSTMSTTAATTVSVTTAVTTAVVTSGGGSGGTGGADQCPDDPEKTEEGECGCGTPDTDTDSDGTPDCNDGCPDDADKTDPGACGCGVADDAACTALANALIHRYSFDDTGTTVTDSVGSANGTLVGGSQSGGLVTLAAGEYVELPSGLLSGLSAVTIEVWYAWGGGGAWQRVFDFGSSDAGAGAQGTGETYLFFTPRAVDGSGVARAAFTPSGGPANEVFIDAAYPSLTGTTSHAAVTVGGGSLALYVNGVLETSAALSDPLSSIDDTNNWIGWSQFEADPGYDGTVREFRIYDAALNNTQIQTSYSLGSDAPLGN